MTLADVQFTQRGNVLVGRVHGELDMSNAEGIGTAVLDATQAETHGVVLDLSAVDYLDSAGIYVLFGLREGLRSRSQTLILVVPGDSPVSDALRLAGVAGHTEIVPRLEAALQRLQSAGADEH